MKYLGLLFISIVILSCGDTPTNSDGQLIDGGGIAPGNTHDNLSEMALEGKKLFESNCAACHYVDRKLIGPALLGVNERRELSWLLKFIRNSQSMIRAGEPTAKKLYEDNQRLVMSSFEHLSDNEIKQILKYIEEYQTDDKILPSE